MKNWAFLYEYKHFCAKPLHVCVIYFKDTIFARLCMQHLPLAYVAILSLPTQKQTTLKTSVHIWATQWEQWRSLLCTQTHIISHCFHLLSAVRTILASFSYYFGFTGDYFKPERQSLYAFQDKTFLNAHTAATNDATCAAEHPTCSGPWWWKLCPSVESPVSSSHCTAHGSTVNTSTPSTFNSHCRWESEEVEGDVWHLTPLISL